MTSAAGQSRPYASPSNVIGVLNRARSRNLPEYISNDFLRLSDVPDSVYGRVTQALRYLGMVEEDGQPSETLRAMSAAPEAQYRELLAGSVRQAYAEDFERVDPSQDSQSKIQDAFSPYQPRSQTQRMVILFLALCREAGIPVLDAPRDRKMQTAPKESRPSARQSRGRTVRKSATPDLPTSSPGTREQAGLAFGVTDSDLASLGDAEFREVWDALGTVMRARARARTMPIEGRESDPDQDDQDDSAADEIR